MLLPFLPFLIAVAGLAVIGDLSAEGMAPLSGGALAAAYAGLLLPGLAMGLFPERWMGSRSPLRLSRRRVVHLAAWLVTAGSAPIAAGLADAMSGLGGGQEAALLALLLNFWVSDGLGLHPSGEGARRTAREHGRRLGRGLAMSLPVVLLMGVGLTLTVAATWLIGQPGMEGGAPPWLGTLGAVALYLLLAGLLLPMVLPACWGLRPLSSPITERIIHDELAANGVSVARVLRWPEGMTGFATAGVIGILPRFRYLLFAEALAGALTPAEVRSVAAHEAAHIKHRHLWYFFACVLAFLLLLQVGTELLAVAALWAGIPLPMWGMVGLELAALLLFLRFGVGAISRNFERQADGNALRRGGLEPFQGAILKIGRLNAIPTGKPNWHHHGIGGRVAYLERAVREPAVLQRQDHRVRRIQALCVGALAVCLAGQIVFSTTGLLEYALEQSWSHRLESEGAAAQLDGLRYLAMRAYERQDLPAAERLFRRLLHLTPDDPTVQNNLAWLLVTVPTDEPERVAEGLHLAGLASRSSQSAYIWDTLAEAYLRANRLSDSEQAARHALTLAEAGKGRGGTPVAYYRERLETLEQLTGAGPAN